MAARPRILVAAQPAASSVLEQMLAEAADMVVVHTGAEAQQALAREAGRIELIVCTFGFDDSRMLDFLQELKRRPETSAIPFLLVRAIKRIFSDDLIARVAEVAAQCGASAFLDLMRLDDETAKR